MSLRLRNRIGTGLGWNCAIPGMLDSEVFN